MFGLTGGIGSNIVNALRAQRAYRSATQRHNQVLTRLSTGLRINRGADDPAGLIAAEGLSQTLAALDAETSANERASEQASAADGALGEVSDLLNRAKSLVSANANTGGLSDDERAANQLEIDSIVSSVNRLSSNTTFGGRKLLDGTATLSASGKSLKLESATPSELGKTDVSGTTYSLADVKSGRPLSTLGDDVTTAGTVLDRAINEVATRRGAIGAFDRNTLQTRLNTVATQREQVVSAVSLIRDTDYAMAAAERSTAELLQRSSLLSLNQALGRPRRRVGTFSILA